MRSDGVYLITTVRVTASPRQKSSRIIALRLKLRLRLRLRLRLCFGHVLDKLDKKPPAGLLNDPFYKIFQKKPPAGRLNDPFYCTCWHRFLLFWDLFRLCHMKSEAFHFAKSFEHGPKASKQLNYIVFNDFIDISMSKIIIFQKNIEHQF